MSMPPELRAFGTASSNGALGAGALSESADDAGDVGFFSPSSELSISSLSSLLGRKQRENAQKLSAFTERE